MTTITSTNELPHGWMTAYQVASEAEAETIRAGRTAYLYHSKINNGLYLYIPTGTE